MTQAYSEIRDGREFTVTVVAPVVPEKARDSWDEHKLRHEVGLQQKIYRDDTRGDGADLLFQN